MVLIRDARKRAAPEPVCQISDEAGATIMVQPSTSGTNDRVASAVGASHTKVTVDDNCFMSLKSLTPPSKKRKIWPKPLEKQDKPPIEDLPMEVLESILSFVNDVGKLLALVNNIKVFRKAIIHRLDVVISTAILGGHDSKDSLESFFDDIRTKSIHIPTTLRLLRVVRIEWKQIVVVFL